MTDKPVMFIGNNVVMKRPCTHGDGLKIVYFLLIFSVFNGLIVLGLKEIGGGIFSELLIDYLMVIIFLFYAHRIKKRKAYLGITLYIVLSLLFVLINMVAAGSISLDTFILYATDFRRIALPFLLVFVFVESLDSLEKILTLNKFLYRLFIVLAYIQAIDFMLFQASPAYKEFITHLMLIAGQKMGGSFTGNAFVITVFGFKIQRSQGFLLDMYASNIFMIILYAYLRLSGSSFNLWHKALALIACISGFSRMFMIMYVVLEAILFIDRSKKGQTNHTYNNGRLISKLISSSLFGVVIMLAAITYAYLIRLPLLVYIHNNIMPIYGQANMFYVLNEIVQAVTGHFHQNFGIFDLFGRGAQQLVGGNGFDLISDNGKFSQGELSILTLLMESGVINFALLVFLLLFSLYSKSKERLFRSPMNGPLHRIYISGKFAVFIGFISMVHSLALFSRQVVIIYMLCYSLSMATMCIARKNNARWRAQIRNTSF